ncbi:MAG: type II toxin-antitoxin system VapB family antitoxin [Hyphomicrobiaceae bacterium]|jgi:Arc/MetJ family transcription regulator
MGINVVLDEALVAEAKKLTGLATETAAIEQILREATARPRSALEGMLELAGRDILRDDYDYKALRAGGGDDDHR